MYPCLHASTHPCIHASIHASMHPFIHLSMHPYIHLFMQPFMHPYIHPCIHAPIHPCIHAPIHASMHRCIHLFVCICLIVLCFVHACTHPHGSEFTHSFAHSPTRLLTHTRERPCDLIPASNCWTEVGHASARIETVKASGESNY